jgi:hypothetical protein
MIERFAIDLETGKIEVTLPSLRSPVYLIADDLVDPPPMTPQQQTKMLRWFEETMKGRTKADATIQHTATRKRKQTARQKALRRMRRGK